MPDPPRSPTVDSWMLPGELARALWDGGADASVRRTARDWAVDAAMFLLSVLFGVVELSETVLPNVYHLPAWLRVTDVVLGVAACLALWWRRRFPVALGIGALVPGAVSNTGTSAVLLLLFSLAVHGGPRIAVPLAAVGVAVALFFTLVVPTVGGDAGLVAAISVLVTLVAVTAGLAVRARRQLVLALRERADAVRREQERRQAESRRDERELIAREMHDVLAHRISLLSVHAGALEYRTAMAEQGGAPPLTTAEVHRAVGVVRSTAHQALEELRDVLQVLRDAEAAGDRPPPQPTADRLPALLEEARRSGQEVTADLRASLAALRPQLQRTVYRVVQEGLTNARKHAPGAPVGVVVIGAPGGDVEVRVTNPLPSSGPESCLPGAGAGLIGLAERVELHGGLLTSGTDGGVFRLSARIPWPS